MSFRISHIHEYDRFIAIDLGSYRIRAALYVLRDGELELESTACVRQHQKNRVDGAIGDMQGVAHAIDKAIHKACAHREDIPDDIIIAFSPALCIHDTLASQYLRDDPDIPLTMDEVDIMIEKIEKSSLIRAKKKAKTEYAMVHDDIRLISSTLTSITIDGKAVAYPIGYQGKHVRINILNIYALASEYNILRSIVSSLKKKTISIVPMPIVLPKILEGTKKTYEDTIYIDIGYTHVTLVFEKKNEIISFETFAIGANMLMDMLAEAYPNLSYTERENLLQREDSHDIESAERGAVAHEYLSYVIDTLISLIVRDHETTKAKNIYVSGGIFSSFWIEKLFFEILSDTIGYENKLQKLSEATSLDKNHSEYLITTGLSYLSKELLHTKKDPVIRILRYTLYHYE